MANDGCWAATTMSPQEEADTLMILHAVDTAAYSDSVHIYTQDSDVLLLALYRVLQLSRNFASIIGTGEWSHSLAAANL